jgi:hypothetical protein
MPSRPGCRFIYYIGTIGHLIADGSVPSPEAALFTTGGQFFSRPMAR